MDNSTTEHERFHMEVDQASDSHDEDFNRTAAVSAEYEANRELDKDGLYEFNTWQKILTRPITKGRSKAFLREFLSGVTVALAQVPEAVAFAFTAGVPPIVGLQAAWMVGTITAMGGGAPGMISGATGAIAVVLPDLIEEYGLGYLFIAVILMGLIQIVFGLVRGNILVKLIGTPVMVGFCNGLAIVIGLAQFHSFKEPNWCAGSCNSNCSDTQSTYYNVDCAEWVDGATGGWQALEVIATMSVVYTLPKLTKSIPSSLMGIIVSTVIEFALVRPVGYSTPTVGDIADVKGFFPIPVWADSRYKSDMPPLGAWKTYSVTLPYAATMAIIGLTESLMTAQLVAQITDRPADLRRECFAQGSANVITGIFGGMGGCAMIGQAMINVKSGGITRISSSVAGLGLLLIILVAYPLINLIPMAALAGVMFMVVIGTFEWHSLKIIAASMLPKKYREKLGWHLKVKRSDAFIIVLVTVVAVVTNLAIAVTCGVLFAAVMFSWDAEKELTVQLFHSEDHHNHYKVSGPIFFASAQSFVNKFTPQHDPQDVTLYLNEANLHDYSALTAINDLAMRYASLGKSLHLRAVKHTSMKQIEKAHHLLYTYDKEEEHQVNQDKLLEMSEVPNWSNIQPLMHDEDNDDEPLPNEDSVTQI